MNIKNFSTSFLFFLFLFFLFFFKKPPSGIVGRWLFARPPNWQTGFTIGQKFGVHPAELFKISL